MACFVPHGDRFYIKDMRADGLGLKVDAAVNTTGDGLRCKGRSAKTGWVSCGFAKEVPENARLVFVLHLSKGNKGVLSSPAKMAPAKG